jgi:toxin FitB
MYILDTNVISELRRPEKADANVLKWAARVPVGQFYLSAITVFEIERSIGLMARRDAEQAKSLRQWFEDHILTTFDGRIFAIDAAVAMRCAQLHVPDPQSDRDSFIAATALVHGMTVVTRNAKDFEKTGVPLINPWQSH